MEIFDFQPDCDTSVPEKVYGTQFCTPRYNIEASISLAALGGALCARKVLSAAPSRLAKIAAAGLMCGVPVWGLHKGLGTTKLVSLDRNIRTGAKKVDGLTDLALASEIYRDKYYKELLKYAEYLSGSMHTLDDFEPRCRVTDDYREHLLTNGRILAGHFAEQTQRFKALEEEEEQELFEFKKALEESTVNTEKESD